MAMILITSLGYGQKWTTGKDLSYLRGQSTLLVKFTYDDMKAGPKEEWEYVKEKKEEYNQKEAGKGDEWAKIWEENKGRVYEPKFEELFNQSCGERLTADRKKIESKYTLIVHVVRMEPGWNVGFSKRAASCDFEILIVKTDEPSVVKSKCMLYNVPGALGGGNDYDTAYHVKECFAESGKILGKKLGKACSR